MSFEENFELQFQNFEIMPPNPKQDHPWTLKHLHADFIELRALLWDKQSYLTLSDAITYYKDIGVNIDFEETNLIEDEVSSSTSEKNDKWVKRFKEYFDLIIERSLIFYESYPFELDGYKIKLRDDLEDIHKLYLYLLLASNLNNFKNVGYKLTSEFETICKNSLEEYLPSFVVEEFGENSTYNGNTITKIKKLSSKLKVNYRKSELRHITREAMKEKGLDLLAYKKFDDEIANMLIILGQCACGKNWSSKKHETQNYESYLDFFRLPPIHAFFIPYNLVNFDNNMYQFFQNDKINKSFFFERKRILESMNKRLDVFKNTLSIKIVEKCIEISFIEV